MKKEIVLMFWDANVKGEKPLLDAIRGLSKHKIQPTTITYLVCEYIFENENLRAAATDKQTIGKNAKERIDFFCNYFKDSNIAFHPIIIPSFELPEGEADNLKRLEAAIQHYIFPKIIELNPEELHITLTSGTQSMRFAWISLYTKSLFTRSFGDNVHIWHKLADRIINEKIDDSCALSEIEIEKNPFIDAIEQKTFKSGKSHLVNLDLDEKIKRNAAINVPMLILGERGIGKSTLVERTIMPEKLSKGFITKDEIQTIACGLLTSNLVEDELFGHEKGAYTGADTQRKGKIELANGGILFLDEIQDLPQSVQRKLLIVLQDKKFTRQGGTEILYSDFKLICASNNTLAELQKKLDPDFFDRIATFKSFLKPLREQDESVLDELWNNRWFNALANGIILPQKPDTFYRVKDVLIVSKMKGNIRDIEQLIAYIARDVYQGITEISEVVKEQRYKNVLSEWLKDYNERYKALETTKLNEDKNNTTSSENIIQDFMKDNSWKEINGAFKKWLADTAINYFGSRKKAASILRCEEKTLYNARME